MAERRRIAVAGGGAAGFFAAIACAEADPGAEVTIHEATAHPLAKVRVSGGGRCNVMHSCFDIRGARGKLPAGLQGTHRPVPPFRARGDGRMVQRPGRQAEDGAGRKDVSGDGRLGDRRRLPDQAAREAGSQAPHALRGEVRLNDSRGCGRPIQSFAFGRRRSCVRTACSSPREGPDSAGLSDSPVPRPLGRSARALALHLPCGRCANQGP